MLTAIVLNKQNQISDTINSLLDFGVNQVVVGTYKPFSSKYNNIKVISVKDEDYAESMNTLLQHCTNDHVLFLREKETILQFSVDNLYNEVYGVQILKQDILLKESRIWPKSLNLRFKNPVFEKVDAEPTKMLDVILYQHDVSDDKIKMLLRKWDKAKPFSMDCYYYRAFEALADKNVNEFKSLITYYLFNSKKEDISSAMARYYLAMIQGLADGDAEAAIQNLIFCIAAYPLMAEFWCLLGDIFVKNNDFDRAIEFYKNSVILGSRRLKTDFWPMQFSKYEEYPNDMITKCQAVLATSKKLTITVT